MAADNRHLSQPALNGGVAADGMRSYWNIPISRGPIRRGKSGGLA